ncbi:MAG: SRPBCC family protein [Acidimicrobiia bacterium]|nr:SRPBCC family protein [Acidimicrobiia bacterium]NNF63989.1 SRPBCC family protein [Acidimicrobiia bacterium]
MKIDNEFEVARPPDVVWAFFQDVPGVASCLPGAELTEDRGDGTYAGIVSVKLGPMNATFEGQASLTPDESTHSAHLEGKGADRKGGSRGSVKVDYRLVATDSGGTTVIVEADVSLAGPAAQFGRTGIINEMSNRLVSDFVACLEAKLEAETPEQAAEIEAGEVNGFKLLLASLVAWLKKILRRS